MAKQGKKKPAPKQPVKTDSNVNNVIKVNATFEQLVNVLANPKNPITPKP